MDQLVSFFDSLVESDSDQAVALLEDVLENLPDAALIIGNERRRILWCNSAAARIFGYSRAEMTGASAGLLHIDEAHFEAFGREFRRKVERGATYRGRYWLKSKAGRRFPTEHIVTPVRQTGGREVYVSIVRAPAGLPDSVAPENYHRLTEREREVFEATARGLSAKEVAYLLEISPRTVELHRANILEKLELGSVRELMGRLWEAARHNGKPFPA